MPAYKKGEVKTKQRVARQTIKLYCIPFELSKQAEAVHLQYPVMYATCQIVSGTDLILAYLN